MKKIKALFSIHKWQMLMYLFRIVCIVFIALVLKQSSIVSEYYLSDCWMKVPTSSENHIVFLKKSSHHTKEEWSKIAKLLQEQLSTHKIIFTSLTQHNQHLLQSPNIIFASEKPKKKQIDSVSFAKLSPLQMDQGVCRSYEVQDQHLAAQLIDPILIPQQKFLIDFSSQPIEITTQDVLHNKFAANTLQGKIVIVPNDQQAKVYSSVHKRNISKDLLRAYTMNTLYNQSFLKYTSHNMVIFAFFLFLALCIVTYELIPYAHLWFFSLLFLGMAIQLISFSCGFFVPITSFIYAPFAVLLCGQMSFQKTKNEKELLSTPCPLILYSLSGQMQKANLHAVEFLKNELIEKPNICLQNLVTELSGCHDKQGQLWVRECIKQQRSIIIDIEGRFLLLISPRIENRKNFTGLICEFIVNSTTNRFGDAGVLVKKMSNFTRSELSKVMLVTSLLQKNSSSNIDLINMIEERVNSICSMTQRCEYYLNLYQDNDEIALFPVDAFYTIEQVKERLDHKFTAKNIELVINKPNFPNYVLANGNLRRLWTIILSILIHNTPQNKQIDLLAQESETETTFHLYNTGKEPREDNLRYDFFQQNHNPKTGHELQWCQETVDKYGGQINATGIKNIGIKFTVTMKIF